MTPPQPTPGAEPTHTVAPLVIVAAELIEFVFVRGRHADS